MHFCSSFYKDKGFFGGYPSKEDYESLIEGNFEYIIDLTTEKERERLLYVYPSHESIKYMNYPINDNSVPENVSSYLQFLIYIVYLLTIRHHKIYIHCKGGHGRSGVVVASLLSLIYNLSAERSLYLASVYHKKRKNLKTKFLKKKIPYVYSQRAFVKNLFQSIYIYPENIFEYNTNVQDILTLVLLRPVHFPFLSKYRHIIQKIVHWRNYLLVYYSEKHKYLSQSIIGYCYTPLCSQSSQEII